VLVDSCADVAHPYRPIHRRPIAALAALAALALVVGLLAGIGQSAAAPPPNPTDQQLQGAQQAKDGLAAEVGQLSGQIALLQARLAKLMSDAERAEQRYAFAVQKLHEAQDAAVAAKAQVKAAAGLVTDARLGFSEFVRSTYMAGPMDGLGNNLLTATNPNQLLQRGDYLQYTAGHQLDALGKLDRAIVAKSNADAAARAAVALQATATAAADAAKQAAQEALSAARQQKADLDNQLAANQARLETARSELATLNNQRTAYVAWKKEQERIAAERAAAAKRAREAAARAAAAAAARAAAALAARATSASAPAVSTAADWGGDGSGPAWSGGGVRASNASWSAAIGQTAANRALAFLGIPYTFAGGNFNGPTYGVPDGTYEARNDASVFGFDCSGLTLYAWGPWVRMDHYAPSQYYEAGQLHPSTDRLMPGDLVFWSGDGTVAGIGHVAIYIGNGNVIQAPFSGSWVQITPLGEVESGYYGATRPLS
jgi:cell wall-associated NlpC family hydrolase